MLQSFKKITQIILCMRCMLLSNTWSGYKQATQAKRATQAKNEPHRLRNDLHRLRNEPHSLCKCHANETSHTGYANVMIMKQATQAMHMPCHDNEFQNIYSSHLGKCKI
jgi:hypothetical protein